jgi:hypothetical protein
MSVIAPRLAVLKVCLLRGSGGRSRGRSREFLTSESEKDTRRRQTLLRRGLLFRPISAITPARIGWVSAPSPEAVPSFQEGRKGGGCRVLTRKGKKMTQSMRRHFCLVGEELPYSVWAVRAC